MCGRDTLANCTTALPGPFPGRHNYAMGHTAFLKTIVANQGSKPLLANNDCNLDHLNYNSQIWCVHKSWFKDKSQTCSDGLVVRTMTREQSFQPGYSVITQFTEVPVGGSIKKACLYHTPMRCLDKNQANCLLMQKNYL